MKVWKKSWMQAIVLSLCAALLLSGCCDKGGGDKSGGGSKSDTSSPVSSGAKSDEPVDYSKYNAYLKLAEKINGEIEPILAVYFSNVDFSPEFTLTGDYAEIKDALQFYTSNTYLVEDALSYLDEKPAYPEADAALQNLGESPAEVMEALNHLASYTRFDEYVDDDMAKAPELHAELWAALQTYDAYFDDFVNAIDIMASQGRDEDRAKLLEDEEMILYHSLCMIHTSQDILDGIWAQIETANTETSPEEPLVLPEIDMTDLSPMFNDCQTAYDGLNQAMETVSEREKVSTFTGKIGDSALDLYKNKVNSLYSRMGSLSEAVTGGTEYAEAFNSASEAIDSMIGGYNSIL